MNNSKLKLLLLLLIGFFCLSEGQAQYTFKVMASSGNSNKVYPKAGGKSLYVGTKLGSSEKITMPSQAYLSLMHTSGATVQINKAGTYSVGDILSKMYQAKKTATENYVAFVYDGLTMKKGEDLHKNPHKYQNVTGSVERATFESELVVMLSAENKGSLIFKKEYRLNWHHLKDTENYIVIVMDHFDETLMEEVVSDTTISINIEDPKFADADLLKVVILSKERPKITPYLEDNLYPFSYLLNFPDADQRAKFEKAQKEFKAEMEEGEVDELSKQLFEAILYENQGFLLDALLTYEKALEMAPENESLQIAYNQFLVRSQIGKHSEIKNNEPNE